jgi:hypothetical protein
LKEQDYEDRIWENSGVPISKTDLWRLVKGDKKTCFDKINEMVQTSILKETTEKNKKMIVRLDSIKKAEFEFSFEFQKRMLELSRSVIKKMKYPMFKKIGIYKTTVWKHHLKRSILDMDIQGEYRARSKVVKHNFEVMSFYYSALLLFISKTNLQRSLDLMTKPEADRRNKKCENALSEHFKKLQSENRREAKAIKQYFKHKIYKIDNFRI